jgi:hypothetical protein
VAVSYDFPQIEIVKGLLSGSDKVSSFGKVVKIHLVLSHGTVFIYDFRQSRWVTLVIGVDTLDGVRLL